MDACSLKSSYGLAPQAFTALPETSLWKRPPFSSYPTTLCLPQSNSNFSRRSPHSKLSNDSFLGTFRPPTCRPLTSPKRQLISAAESSNGKGEPQPEKRKPKNKIAVEPTFGDRVQGATTKLLNVTVYPLGIAGLVTVLPVVWGVRLYKFFTQEPLEMKDKVVLITGASSGIGEHMAYEYARLGARLALVARREEKLHEVAEEARLMGSPEVMVFPHDLGNEEGCKAAVEETLEHFQRLDTLVLNCGIFHFYLFEDATDTKRFDTIMDTNFWSYVYTTYHALKHLKKTNGQIVVNSSVSSLVPQPRNSIYNASKIAVTWFFHTLRIELGDKVPITIFSPGVVKSELSDGKLAQDEGKVPKPEEARQLRNEQLGLYPIVPTAMLAREAVKAARYKKHDITLPVWYNMLAVYQALAPEALDAFLRWWLVQKPSVAKQVIDTVNPKAGELGQPTQEDYEKGGFPKGGEQSQEEKPREKAGSRR